MAECSLNRLQTPLDAPPPGLAAMKFQTPMFFAVHVDTTENLSDLFTKALDLATFTRFRKQLMHFHAIPIVAH